MLTTSLRRFSSKWEARQGIGKEKSKYFICVWYSWLKSVTRHRLIHWSPQVIVSMYEPAAGHHSEKNKELGIFCLVFFSFFKTQHKSFSSSRERIWKGHRLSRSWALEAGTKLSLNNIINHYSFINGSWGVATGFWSIAVSNEQGGQLPAAPCRLASETRKHFLYKMKYFLIFSVTAENGNVWII